MNRHFVKATYQKLITLFRQDLLKFLLLQKMKNISLEFIKPDVDNEDVSTCSEA